MISLLSTVLGYCIVLGSFLTLLPQILKIHKEWRVDGLILSSLLIELVGLINGLAINWILGNPLSVYGELIPAICQTFLLSYLVILLTYGELYSTIFTCSFLFVFISIFVIQPFRILWWCSLPITISILFAKFRQILHIYSQGDSGVLSLSSSVLGTLGVCVRCFTTIVLYMETDPDKKDITGVIIAVLFTLSQILIVLQIIYYDYIKDKNKKEK